MPNSPSTMSDPRHRSGKSATVAPPPATKARYAAAASGRQLGRVTAKDHGHVEEGLAQAPRDDEGVAAVVAGPREHEDGSAPRAEHVPGDVGSRRSRALHQRLPAGRFLRAAQLLRSKNGKETHRVDYISSHGRSSRIVLGLGPGRQIRCVSRSVDCLARMALACAVIYLRRDRINSIGGGDNEFASKERSSPPGRPIDRLRRRRGRHAAERAKGHDFSPTKLQRKLVDRRRVTRI